MIMTETQFRNMHAPGPIARLRGVAVVAESFPCRPKCLDTNDCFIEPELDCFQEMMSLEHCAEMAEKLEYFRNDLLLDGIRRQAAYNKLFELIAERLSMPGFTVFCTDVSGITDQIRKFNVQQAEMRDEIAGEGAPYTRKQEILQTVFRPIALEAVEFSAEAVAAVREQLHDLSVFRQPLTDPVTLLLGEGNADGL